MIEKLTQLQQDNLPGYVKKWVDIGINTDEIDFLECVNQIKKAYEVVGLASPTYFIGPVNNPYEAAVAEYIIGQFSKEKKQFNNPAHLNQMVLEEIQNQIKSSNTGNTKSKLSISNQAYGFQEYWLSYYDFFINECNLAINLVKPLIDLSKVCGWWTPLKDVAIIQHRPLEIHRDNAGRLHNADGAAVRYLGIGADVFFIHGVRVTKKIIDRDFTADDIEKESNAEVRRVMIEIYGQANFLIESCAVKIHEDDFGVLYRKDLRNDEPLMMVKVVNSTIESDGTFKDYFIRVDPNAYGGIKTAHAAVASTWRNKDGSMLFNKPEDYNCDIQT
jgi:hypothetical protein